MKTLTITLPKELKELVCKKADEDGVTLTFLITQFFQAYLNDEVTFVLARKKRKKSVFRGFC